MDDLFRSFTFQQHFDSIDCIWCLTVCLCAQRQSQRRYSRQSKSKIWWMNKWRRITQKWQNAIKTSCWALMMSYYPFESFIRKNINLLITMRDGCCCTSETVKDSFGCWEFWISDWLTFERKWICAFYDLFYSIWSSFDSVYSCRPATMNMQKNETHKKKRKSKTHFRLVKLLESNSSEWNQKVRKAKRMNKNSSIHWFIA